MGIIDVENYNRNRGIYSPLILHGNMVCGFWMVGNDYHNKSKMYGAYPPNYLKRISWLFPGAKNILHLFSGMVEKGTWPEACEVTMDIRSEMNPNVMGDAEEARKYFEDETFNLILSDPPYGENYVHYGTEKVNKKKVIWECSYLLKKGGCLVWLDDITPIWAKRAGWRQAGAIGLQQSTNHKVRVITILEKVK